MSGAASASHGRNQARWAARAPLTFQESKVIVVIAQILRKFTASVNCDRGFVFRRVAGRREKIALEERLPLQEVNCWSQGDRRSQMRRSPAVHYTSECLFRLPHQAAAQVFLLTCLNADVVNRHPPRGLEAGVGDLEVEIHILPLERRQVHGHRLPPVAAGDGHCC